MGGGVGVGGQVLAADAAGGGVGVEGAVRVEHAILQADGVAQTQRVGVVGDVVNGRAVLIQRDGIDPDGNGRGRHCHPQRLHAAGVLIDGDQDIVDVAAAVHRAVKGFAAVGSLEMPGIRIAHPAAGLGLRGGHKTVLQFKRDARPQNGLDGIHLHILADGVVVQDVTAVDRVSALHLGGAFGGAGDAVDNAAEGVPQRVGIGRGKVTVGIIEAGGVVRLRGHVHGIILRPAGGGVLHLRRGVQPVLLPGGVDGVHLRHAGGGVDTGAAPVGGGVQHQVGHGGHAGILLVGHKADGKDTGALPRLGVGVIVRGDGVFEVGRRYQRQKPVAAVGVVVVAGADGRVFDAQPPVAAGRRPREGGGCAVGHDDQVGYAGKGLVIDLHIGIGGVQQHLHALVDACVDVGVGIQRDGGLVNVAGDLHVAVVAVILAGGGVPVADGQVIPRRPRRDGAQREHRLRAAVEHHNADAVLVVGVHQRGDGVVDAVHHGLYPAFGLGGHGAAAVLVLAPGHAGREIQHKHHVYRGGGLGDDLGGGGQRRVSHQKIGIVLYRDSAGVTHKLDVAGVHRLVRPDAAVQQRRIVVAQADQVIVAGVGVGHAVGAGGRGCQRGRRGQCQQQRRSQRGRRGRQAEMFGHGGSSFPFSHTGPAAAQEP